MNDWKNKSLGSKMNLQSSSTCEAELQELMVQIDKLIQEKKQEWEKDFKEIENKLESKKNECSVLKHTIEQRDKEVTQLRRRLDESEMSRKSTYAEYEMQSNSLRQEVQQIGKSYEKMQKKYMKQVRDLDREKERLTVDITHIVAQKKSLESKLDDYESQLNNWEQERVSMMKKIDHLSEGKASAEEKLELMQEQTANYQQQLERRKQILDSTESSLKSQIAQLEQQLNKEKQALNGRSKQLEQAKETLDETVANYRRVFEEKEHLEKDIHTAKKTICRQENEVSRLTKELENAKNQLEYSHKEITSKTTDLSSAHEQIRKLNEQIKMLEAASHKKDLSSTVTHLEKELFEARQTIKHQKRVEKRQADDLHVLTKRLEETERQCAQLDAALAKSKEDTYDSSVSEITALREEVKKPNDQHQCRTNQMESETRHIAELSTIRRSTLEVQEELLKSHRDQEELNDRLSSSEKRTQIVQEDSDRQNVALQLANAQLEALRLENRYLRSCVDKVGENAADEVAQAENHMKRLQTAYVAALEHLETEKKELNVRLDRTREYSESQVTELNQAVQKLETEKRRLSQQLRTQNESIRSLNQDYSGSNKGRSFTENLVLSSFVEGISKTLSPQRSCDPQHCWQNSGKSVPSTSGKSTSRTYQQHKLYPNQYFLQAKAAAGDTDKNNSGGDSHLSSVFNPQQQQRFNNREERLWQVNNHKPTTPISVRNNSPSDPGINESRGYSTEITQYIDPSLPLDLDNNSGFEPLPSYRSVIEEEEVQRLNLEAKINSNIESLKQQLRRSHPTLTGHDTIVSSTITPAE